MYLLTQLAVLLFIAFALGVAVGYGLWRLWGKRRLIARYGAAEMRLAAYLSQFETAEAASDFLDANHR